MPLVSHRYLQPEGELGLWQIGESEAFFLDRISLHPLEAAQLAEIKGHRRVEWLASRWLLHEMSGRQLRAACLKDEFGKPHLEGSFYDISLSHSHELVAVIAAPRLVGVDIQYLVTKIERIAYKFMRPEEAESLESSSRIEHLHVYWGAKECLYKAYGRRSLDFKTHILIEPFRYQQTGGRFSGRVLKDAYNESFELWYERLGDFILVYGMADIGDQRLAFD